MYFKSMEAELNRFIEAQKTTYNSAISEIRSEKKSSHWMWFIFPQIDGLGISSTSRQYAIKSVEEARSYYHHPILGARLKEITTAFMKIENKSAHEILGRDAQKMKSCMTLFNEIQEDTNLFSDVLAKYFEGSRCAKTIFFTQ